MVADKSFNDSINEDFGVDDDLEEENFFEETDNNFNDEDDFFKIAEPETQNQGSSFFRIAIITAFIGAILGGVSLWGFNKYFNISDNQEISSEEGLINENVQTNDIEGLNLPHPEKTISDPIEKPSRIKKTKYYISVANCLDDECVRLNQLLLKKQKIRSIVTRFVEKTIVSEVISEKRYDGFQATQWVNIINQTRKLPGQAYRKSEGNYFRLSLGLFPDQDSARAALSTLNQIFKGHFTLILQTVQQKTLYQQIRTRDYNSKNQILALQKRLLELDEKFPMILVEESY